MAEAAAPQPPPPSPPPPKWTDVAISNVAVVVILIALFFAYLCTPSRHANRYQKLADRYRLPADADADSEWRLATDITGDQPLKVHTRVRAGELSFRMSATLDASVAEIVSLARETDLMPVWNPYCRVGGLLEERSMWELWAWADFKFSPLPVPPMFTVVHAILEDHVSTSGHWYCRVSYAPPPPSSSSSESKPENGDDAEALLLAHERSAIPDEVLTHGEVRLSYAFGTLHPIERPRGVPPRTRVEIELALDLTHLTAFGPLRFLRPPAWLVNIVTRVMIPGIWREALAAVGKMQSDGRNGPIGKRIHEDPSGVYKRVKKVSRQQ